MSYSPELARQYTEQRDQYNETDELLFAELTAIDVVDKQVLDIGCGAGRHARWLALQGGGTDSGWGGSQS